MRPLAAAEPGILELAPVKVDDAARLVIVLNVARRNEAYRRLQR